MRSNPTSPHDAGGLGLLAGILFFLLEMSLRFVDLYLWAEEQPPAGYLPFLAYYALAGLVAGSGIYLLRHATKLVMGSSRAVLRIGAPALALLLVLTLIALAWLAVMRLRLGIWNILFDAGAVLVAAAVFVLIFRTLVQLKQRFGTARVLAAHTAVCGLLIGIHLISLRAVTLGPTLARLPATAGEIDKPNILMITADTLRADRLATYGYRQGVSPNIDRLAAEGALFQQAVAHSPWTRPSFGSLLTSTYPSQHGAYILLDPDAKTFDEWNERKLYDGGLNDDATTMAEILSGHGYTTLALQTNIATTGAHGFDRGFDLFLYNSLFVPPMAERSLLGAFVRWAQMIFGIQPESSLYGLTPNADKVYDLFEILYSRGLPQPFFAWLNLMDPHSPYVGREPGVAVEKARVTGVHHARDPDVPTGVLSEAYDDEVRFLDHYVGKTIDLLREQGVLDDTIVIFTSDHGEEFEDHGIEIRFPTVHMRGRYHGHSLYSELIRAPLILRFPRRIPGGRQVGRLVRHVDVLPTVLELAAIDPGKQGERFEGTSLLPLIEGTEAAGGRLAYAERNLFGAQQRSVQDGRYKLIFHLRDERLELYDLEADPGETTDLSETHPEAAERLLAHLDAWSARLPAPPSSPEIRPESAEALERLRDLGYVE